jgi:hypothetical protein
LDAALDACGIADHRSEAVQRDFGRLLRIQEELHLHHELGEIHETAFRRDIWREIVAAFPLTRVELVVRRVKDFLADTQPVGPLRRFCRDRNRAGIALFMANCDRVARAIFPESAQACDALLVSGDWTAVEQAVTRGRRAACAHVKAIEDAHAAVPSRLEALIEERFGGALGRLPQEPE